MKEINKFRVGDEVIVKDVFIYVFSKGASKYWENVTTVIKEIRDDRIVVDATPFKPLYENQETYMFAPKELVVSKNTLLNRFNEQVLLLDRGKGN